MSVPPVAALPLQFIPQIIQMRIPIFLKMNTQNCFLLAVKIVLNKFFKIKSEVFDCCIVQILSPQFVQALHLQKLTVGKTVHVLQLPHTAGKRFYKNNSCHAPAAFYYAAC